MSFLASFVLVRYKLEEAKKEEAKVESEARMMSGLTQSPTSSKPPDLEKHASAAAHEPAADAGRARTRVIDSSTGLPIQSCNPRIEQVYGFTTQPPTELMRRCHALCIALATAGFVLALMGTVCSAWARQPVSVAVFSSAVMGVCLVSGAAIMVW